MAENGHITDRAAHRRVAVIGGGLGGLAAACTLAARGHTVTLFEANRVLGGKAVQLEEKGFRFDMGPTILTMPEVLGRIFSEAGRNLHDALVLERLDPQWRCFFEDGSVLDLAESIDAMSRNLEAYASPEVAQGYRRFVELSERLHGISEKFFFWRSVGGLRDTVDVAQNLRVSTIRDVLALRMGRSVAKTIRAKVADARVAQMLDHFTQYVGSSPYGSPAVLCGIAHMQLSQGVWYPIGGTRAVPEALSRLARDLGVEVRTETSIAGIRARDGRVTGVVVEGRPPEQFDAVISNMDSVRTHRELLHTELPPSSDHMTREPACSGVVLYLGLRKRYEHLQHHNFVFSRDHKEEFEHIYERGEPAPDPTCYVAAPARTEAAVAPAGGEALYVLVHTPYLRAHHDWRAMFPAYRRRILDKLKCCAGLDDIEDRIEFEAALTPEDIHKRYRVLNGAIYGLASHGKYLGAFKPGNRSPHLAGLYLAGGSAHPGPGMPMALMSGWIAADCLDSDARAAGAAAA